MNAAKISVESLKNHIEDKFRSEKNTFPLEVFTCSYIQKIFAELQKNSFNIDYVAGSLISVASTAIGNGARLQVKVGYEETAVVFVMLNGLSGTGKTAPLKMAMYPFLRRDIKSVNDYNDALKKSEEESKKPFNEQEKIDVPKLRKIVITDATVEAVAVRHLNNQHALILMIDELPGWFLNLNKYNNGSAVEFYLTAHSSGVINIDRKKDGALMIENPHISIVGGIQPQVLSDIFKKEVNNGLLARFLIFSPADRPLILLTDEQMDPIVYQYWERIVTNLRDIYFQDYQTKKLHYSEEAWKVVKSFVNSMELSESEAVSAMDSKLKGYTHRLALILHLMNHAYEGEFSTEISAETVRSSIKLIKYFRYNAMFALKNLKLDNPIEALDENKKRLYDMLPEQFTTGDGQQIAKENNFLGHTAFSKFLKNKRLFKKINQGVYEKLITDGNED